MKVIVSDGPDTFFDNNKPVVLADAYEDSGNEHFHNSKFCAAKIRMKWKVNEKIEGASFIANDSAHKKSCPNEGAAHRTCGDAS